MNFLSTCCAVLSATRTVAWLTCVFAIGCSEKSPPSPYHDVSTTVATIELPEIQVTHDTFSADGLGSKRSLIAQTPARIALTFKGSDEHDIPPFVVLYWHRISEGKVLRPDVQQHSARVDRDGAKGTAVVVTTTPKVPGEYQIEIRTRLADKERVVDFPITISPKR
jgi:hypothetical protein